MAQLQGARACSVSFHSLTVMECRNSCGREAALLPGRPGGEPRHVTWAVCSALTAEMACQDVDETLPLAELKDLRFVLFPETGRWSKMVLAVEGDLCRLVCKPFSSLVSHCNANGSRATLNQERWDTEKGGNGHHGSAEWEHKGQQSWPDDSGK